MSINGLAAFDLYEYYSLREDTHVDFGTDPGSPLVLTTPDGLHRVDRPSGLLRDAVRRMLLGAVSLRNVVADFPAYDTPPESLDGESRRLLAELERLQEITVRTLAVGARPLLSLVPLDRDARLAPRPMPAVRAGRLARSAVVRRAGGGLVLESPRAHYRAELHGPEALRVLDLLGAGGAEGPGSAAPQPVPLPAPVVAAAMAYLAAAGLVDAAPTAVSSEDHQI
ncbi:hypothetical protein [Streptomyces rimosus]|uniref:hypothetical protein n=1 Tax=Streptomyces rimosus TaxID=1927 RepID=UPI000AD016BB|nr:hypothetical protein [Streptomyces rimosus]